MLTTVQNDPEILYLNLADMPPDFDFLWFSAGEPHLNAPKDWVQNTKIQLKLWAPIQDWNDWGRLLVLLDTLATWADENAPNIDLYIPYFPGSRQDRQDETTPHTLGLYAHMLHLYFSADYGANMILHTYDMHSEMGKSTLRLRLGFGNVIFHGVEELWTDDFDPDIDLIIAPDKGAVERVHDFADTHFPDAKIIYATKERDFNTGKIIKYEFTEPIPAFTKALVVDDICDGGRTFLELAELFRQTVASPYVENPLQLYVSHGIFAKGLDELSQHYDTIYTTTSRLPLATPGEYPIVKDQARPRLVVIPCPGSEVQ